MLNHLLKPKIIDVDFHSDNYAKVVLEPFERGFGHTLGNALRRVLLSSMEGFAVTEVQIGGVLHEYSTIEGVQEDVVDILLNLKEAVFVLEGRGDVTLSVKKVGPGNLVLSDFELPHDVEVCNPNLVLARLSDNAELDIQIRVQRGRGYVPGSLRQQLEVEGKTIGKVVLDATFSPVKMSLESTCYFLHNTYFQAPKEIMIRKEHSLRLQLHAQALSCRYREDRVIKFHDLDVIFLNLC